MKEPPDYTKESRSADTVRLVRTVHVRTGLGNLASTVPFKLGIDAKIVDVEWDREVALVTWLVPHSDGTPTDA